MSVFSNDPHLDAALVTWLKIDKNPKTHQEVLDDISNARWDKLKKTMFGRQKFGTAGLRGLMGAGYMCINDVVVLQTAQGFCSYLKKCCSQEQLHNGIVIGYDGRYNSKRFAELTAKVFVTSSIPVYLFSTVCPTPFVSFATIEYGAAGGIMVTASHNPKEDNGYKVYWGNGSQIIHPHDRNILDEINHNLEISDEHWNIDGIRNHKLVKDCIDEVTNKYMEYIHDTLSQEMLESNRKAAIETVYTAMHGVGYEYVLKAFAAANLKAPISVKEQQDPDPEFPTVKFPNPEELECLNLSKKLAEERGVQLVLANDPDADRLAVAEYDESGKSWKIFSGNEMGALLGWWLLHQYEKQHGVNPDSNLYVIASVVSSKMLRAIIEGKGHFVETLTGFKWMGNTTLVLAHEGKTPLFAFEEAIGYMCHHRVPDKDGVSAAVHVASLASHLYNSGSTLSKQLQALYLQYGYHVTHNSYYICHDPAVIQRIFSRIRNYHGTGEMDGRKTDRSCALMACLKCAAPLALSIWPAPKGPTESSAGYRPKAKYPRKVGDCEIVALNDLAAGVKIPEVANGDRHLTVLGTGLDQDYTSGEMIMFRCSNGLSVTLRTSGTEPKIKYYSELVCKADTVEKQEETKSNLEKMVREFVDDLLQPKENGLLG